MDPLPQDRAVIGGELEGYLCRAADDLPVIPAVAARVIQVVDDPDSSVGDLMEIIEQDASLTVRLLRIANSPFYGFSGDVSSLSRAISLIGGRAVRNLVLGISMKSTFHRFGLMEKLLWEHATLTGPVIVELARHSRIDTDLDEAFIAGLLHDIGKNALANSHRDEYEKVVARVYNEKISFVQAERDQFGFDHAELGACVAERWRLPARIVMVLRNHHAYGRMTSLPEAEARLTALVAVSTACLTRNGIGRREPAENLNPADLPVWRFLGFDESDVEPILLVCREQVERAQALVD